MEILLPLPPFYPFECYRIMEFTGKQIRQITYPVLISLLMEHLIGLTDTAYLGRVGEVELGASALAGVYYLALFMLGFGFSVGAQILIGRRNGAQGYKKIGPVFMQGTLFLVGVACTIFILSGIYSPKLLRVIIESDDIYEATMSYLNWRIYGLFFSFAGVMFRAFYVGTTRTRILTINSLVMVLTNVVLNYILIFGKLGFPALGIAGAAIASTVSEAVSVLFFILHTRFRLNYKMYGLFRFAGLDWQILKQILNVSVWTMIQSTISIMGWFIFFIAVEHLGERPLAITNIVRSISSLLFMFVNAFASTGSSLVSNLIGAGKQEEVLPLTFRIIRMCYLFVIPLALLIAIFPTVALRIYTDAPDLIRNTVPALWVMLSSYLLSVPGFIFFFAVSGTGNTRSALLIELGSLAVYMAYTLYVVGFLKADVAVCWTTEHVYAGMIMLSFFYLWKGNWRNKKI